MSSEVPELSPEQIMHLKDTHVGEPTAQIPLCASDWLCFARAIEQAVRAQWAAEVEPWKAMVWALARELNCLPSTFSDGNAHVLKAAIKLNAERDSALAEAKAAKEALRQAELTFQLITDQDPIENALDPQWAARIAKHALATLTNPRAGETA